MDPPFGQSNIFFRVRRIIRKGASSARKRTKETRMPKPTLGKVWLRLSYYETRLMTLNDENREMFIENFYHSARQINYITMLTVLVVIGTFLTTFQFRMIGFLEGLTVEILLIFSLFYIVWYYRLGMEDLMDYLMKTEMTPSYAFRPRLGPKDEQTKPLETSKNKYSKRIGKR